MEFEVDDHPVSSSVCVVGFRWWVLIVVVGSVVRVSVGIVVVRAVGSVAVGFGISVSVCVGVGV